MRIAEIFYSIQGEGKLAGTPSVFIRTSGCNLRCTWCDTPYTSWKPEGEEWSMRAILHEVARYLASHAVITGGEPFLSPEIEELTYRLKERNFHLTVETAATVFKPVVCDLMSLSPKLSHSTPRKRLGGKFASMHEGNRLNLPVIQEMIDRYDCQLKFVVGRKQDLKEIESILKKLQGVDRGCVMLMAQAKTRSELRRKASCVIDLCKEYRFSYSPRLQIELYGNRRGT